MDIIQEHISFGGYYDNEEVSGSCKVDPYFEESERESWNNESQDNT